MLVAFTDCPTSVILNKLIRIHFDLILLYDKQIKINSIHDYSSFLTIVIQVLSFLEFP